MLLVLVGILMGEGKLLCVTSPRFTKDIIIIKYISYLILAFN